jgi:hypothetical protein
MTILKWVGFTVFAVTVFGLARGITGLMEHGGCPDGRRRCAAPPGLPLYMGAILINSFAVFAGFFAVVRTADRRPTLGLLLGAVAGAVFALAHGTTVAFWILSAALLMGATATVLGLRTIFTGWGDVLVRSRA